MRLIQIFALGYLELTKQRDEKEIRKGLKEVPEGWRHGEVKAQYKCAALRGFEKLNFGYSGLS